MRQSRLEKGLIHTSGKMVLLDKLLPKLRSEGHKVGSTKKTFLMFEIVSCNVALGITLNEVFVGFCLIWKSSVLAQILIIDIQLTC